MAAGSVRATIGLVSDTHGLVRPETLAALAGVQHVLHAGDVGDARVLAALARVAPVTAVRGNNDRGAWAERLPARALVRIAGIRLLVVHEAAHVAAADLDADVDVLVTGHSHRPSIGRHGPVLHVNPGSAGPRRFRLPVALALLDVTADGVTARIVELAETSSGVVA